MAGTMTADAGTTAPAGKSTGGRVPSQAMLGERYAVGHLVRHTSVAEVYTGTDTEATGMSDQKILSC